MYVLLTEQKEVKLQFCREMLLLMITWPCAVENYPLDVSYVSSKFNGDEYIVYPKEVPWFFSNIICTNITLHSFDIQPFSTYMNPFSAKQRPYHRICNDISLFGTKRVKLCWSCNWAATSKKDMHYFCIYIHQIRVYKIIFMHRNIFGK